MTAPCELSVTVTGTRPRVTDLKSKNDPKSHNDTKSQNDTKGQNDTKSQSDRVKACASVVVVPR